MKKKKCFFLLVAIMMVFSMIPTTVLANETRENRTIDFSTFLEEVANAEYNYNGKGVTVEWSPSSACTNPLTTHTCLFSGESAPEADGNNPQRGQIPNAQYQIFNGQEDVKIVNVNFKFNPADFTICMNSAWKGKFLKDDVKNAEFQMLNTGDVYFSGCSFDGVIVSPFGSRTKSTFIDCDFKNVYNAYAIKDIYSSNASITGCTFDSCGGGIYFEGDAAKEDIVIKNNIFKNIDTYAAAGKEFTRGLIQFSAKGDYSNADITIAGNTSTGEAAAVRQLNTTITADVLELDEVVENNEFSGNVLTDSSFGTNTVYYNGTYYATLSKALTGVYMHGPQSTAKIYCKPGADVGTMTHGHVADDIIIYGNGAKVSGGERDLEFDTYKYDRTRGLQNKNGLFLEKDITVKVFDLNGIAAWGQRNTAHTINLFFENCKNMQRIYFTNGNNQDGEINISLNNCSFDGSDEELKSNANTAVYSNSAGNITISNTTFKDISVAININHKSAGVQNITLTNCIFEDCSLSDSPQAESTKTYAAPIRIVAKEGATTNLVIKDAEFIYSEGKENCGNGDILIGDGRSTASEIQGIVTLGMTGTNADVMVQEKGYYGEDGNIADTTKAKTTAVIESNVLVPNEDTHFEFDEHDSIEVVGAKDATCTSEGYTGDKVCKVCGKEVEKGEMIPMIDHDTELQGVKESTCSAKGYTGDRVCKVCGKKVEKGEMIPTIDHDTELQGVKESTCSAKGYTGDKVCKVCGEVVEKGKSIEKIAHDFQDGKCTVCGAAAPDYVPAELTDPDTDTPQTGDNTNLALWVVLVLASFGGLSAILLYRRKSSIAER